MGVFRDRVCVIVCCFGGAGGPAAPAIPSPVRDSIKGCVLPRQLSPPLAGEPFAGPVHCYALDVTEPRSTTCPKGRPNMKLTCRHWLAAALICIGWGMSTKADVKLPSIIADNMVLQADKPLPIWGWAEPGEDVAVTLGDDRASAKAAA